MSTSFISIVIALIPLSAIGILILVGRSVYRSHTRSRNMGAISMLEVVAGDHKDSFDMEGAKQFISSLLGLDIYVCEVVRAPHEGIRILIGADEQDIPELTAHIQAHYPTVRISPAPHHALYTQSGYPVGFHVRLRRHEKFSIATHAHVKKDQFQQLIAPLQWLRSTDSGIVQCIVEKGNRVTIRIFYTVRAYEDKERILHGFAQGLSGYDFPGNNQFVIEPFVDSDSSREDMELRIPDAGRAMQLGVPEIASLFHIL